MEISQQQKEIFLKDGVLVVDNVIPMDVIEKAKASLAMELADYGVDTEDLVNTGQHLEKLSSTNGAGGILDIFYSKWRMELIEHENAFHVMSQLYDATYASNKIENFQHPHGKFDPCSAYFYLNRVCYRVPDTIAKLHGAKKSKPLQRSLTPHLDCCPENMYGSDKEFARWRPIQCFIALTDNVEPNTGGFEAVKGFHTRFDEYFHQHNNINMENDGQQVCVGDFSPLQMHKNGDVIKEFRHVSCKAGSMVFWDWRIPHANSYKHTGHLSRQVVYSGFLPNVAINAKYAKEQLRRYVERQVPTDHWQRNGNSKVAVQNYELHHFSDLGSKLIGMKSWSS